MPRSIDEVYDAVLDVKTDVISLREHVNDRNDSIQLQLQAMDSKIDGKLAADQLLTSLGFALLNSAWARWAFGLLFVAMLGSTIGSHWLPLFRQAINTLPSF